jgi:AcrR family transcriptional regulator
VSDQFTQFESSAKRRRRQLTRVASNLIEVEGVNAVQMDRIAELAGCSRPLVYRYFRGRDELLAAVLDDFGSDLDERLDAGAQSKGFDALSQGSIGGAPAVELLSSIWDCVAECGMGGWVLRTTADLDPNLHERLQPSFDNFHQRWVEPMTAGGMTELEASLVFRAASAMVTELLRRWRAGTLKRDAAIALGVKNTLYLVDGALKNSNDKGEAR